MGFYYLSAVKTGPHRVDANKSGVGCSVAGSGFRVRARRGECQMNSAGVPERSISVPQRLTERKEFNAQKS